ncbi:MAG TPA: PRC-barrel domain-containing protein [Alphaproteobacteria bacterium]|nr:PRC-barrel domain-containing protein [Alphaproteobacteria bacterium]
MATYDPSMDPARNADIHDEHVEETGALISANKVQGTSVYNAVGDDLGTIHDVMIDKRSGRVAYAVMSFGGFLGIGEKYHPLPWNVLTYDEDKGGYNIDLSTEQLRSAPSYSSDELHDFGGRTESERVQTYYGGLGYPPII